MKKGIHTHRDYLNILCLWIAGFLFLSPALQVQGQPYLTKQGGICFRIENNPTLTKLHQIDSIFSIYAQPFSMAMTSWVFPLSPSYVDSLISYIAKGYEVMDNTPTHQIQYFNLLNSADTSLFAGNPGVDHFYQGRVCLSYTAVDTFQSHGEGLVDVYGNMVISHNPGEFGDLTGNPYFFALYLNTLNRVYLWYDRHASNPADPDTVFIRSFWEEPVNVGTKLNLHYHKLTQLNVIMKPEAIRLLGQRSLDLFAQHNIPRPFTWIHPAGQMPMLNGFQIRNILGDTLLYTAGANYVNQAHLCFNEYNPAGINQFGMQNDQLSISQHTFAWNKHAIANFAAKHFVKMDISTLENVMGGWPAYLQRLDSLLNWCLTNGIPIGTYSQWKTWLFDSVPTRIANIFPRLHVDLDQDNYPDGYDQLGWINSQYDTTEGVPASGNCSFLLTETGYFCQVTHLAGLETGKNYFYISAKNTGTDSTRLQVQFTFPENGQVQAFDFTVDTNSWIQFNEFVVVPDSVTLMNVLISRTDTMPDTLRISGMVFKSAGFLTRSAYPPQTVYQNEQFSNIDLYQLVIDTIYNPATITWWVQGQDTMNFKFNSNVELQPLKPVSFWIGQDTAWLMAKSPDGIMDSCRLTYASLPMQGSCPGLPLTITLLDTLDNDFITWTSEPYDSTISDPHVFNPTVNPQVTTLYRVTAISPLGPIHHDSLLVVRYPVPQPSLPSDTVLCEGNSITLVATGGIYYLWNTGATTASIVVSPSVATMYSVLVTNQYGCSGTDSVLVTVHPLPEVAIIGLWPAYCVYDYPSSAIGYPPGGVLSGTGLVGDIFYPELAILGQNIITYHYTDSLGCSNTDTISVYVYPRPVIQPQPTDTSVCADKSITLHAGPGNTSYLWSNGIADSVVTVDTTGVGLGQYLIWVYVTKNGCVNMDTAYITFVECPIGVNEPGANTGYRIYPNPAGEYVQVEAFRQKQLGFRVEIIDLTGKTILTVPESKMQVKIPLEKLPPGLYLIRILEEERACFFRLVRQ